MRRDLRVGAIAAIALLLLSACRHALLLDSPTPVAARRAIRQQHYGFHRAHGAGRPAPPRAVHTESPARAIDGTLEAALRLAAPSGSGVVLLTFGNIGYRAPLTNFIAHTRACGAPFVIGAVDAAVFEAFAPQRVAVYKTPLALEASYRLDGSNAHASGSWQRFAAMRTGEVSRIVSLGFHVLHTDVDVVWLRNPAPYVACAAGAAGEATAGGAGATAAADPPALACDTLAAADVAVSSDNMSPGQDASGGVAYAIGGTLNTGVLLVRATEAGKRFAAEWHRAVVSRACPLTDRTDCRRRCVSGSCQADGTCAGDCHGGRCCTSDQQVLNRMMRDEKAPYPGLAVPRGAARTVFSPHANVSLGSLPLALFLHGHGYFVQRSGLAGAADAAASSRRAPARALPRPYAVHATYTLDRHDEVAKAQRFREAGLWRADPPAFAQGRFLALGSSVPPEVSAAINARPADGAANIATHLIALRAYAAELRDALALALALGRTLVLPRWTCYCDRLWSGSDDIFHFGCMYPGAQDASFVPFSCPMDHVLSPAAWAEAGVPYRDPLFLEDSTLSVRDASFGVGAEGGRSEGDAAGVGAGKAPLRIVEVAVAGPAGGAAAAAGEAGPRLELGTSEVEVARVLQPYADAPVLRLSHARGLLSGLADAGLRTRVNDLSARLLRPLTWCSTCFQPCKAELAKWLDAAAIASGADGPNRWCARFEAPAALQAPPMRNK